MKTYLFIALAILLMACEKEETLTIERHLVFYKLDKANITYSVVMPEDSIIYFKNEYPKVRILTAWSENQKVLDTMLIFETKKIYFSNGLLKIGRLK